MKVRMFLFLFLSFILFYSQPRARVADILSENNPVQPNDSSSKIDTREKLPVRIADSFINRHAASEIYDSLYCGKWTCAQGMILEALHQMWLYTHEAKYLTYVKSNVDMFIGGDGSIRTYNYNDFNLENINTGRQLLFLYSITKNKKYRIASDTLMKQLKNQPRSNSGDFSYKKNYPSQTWLEGLYMCEPFYAQYSKMFRQNKNFNDIAIQFIVIKDKTLDGETGLLSRAFDEIMKEKWADPKTGKSPEFSAPALGSYLMALVDVLDYFPRNHPKRKELISILRDLSDALVKVRDVDSHLWHQRLNQGEANENYPESTASCMIGYAFAKGANKGYLDKKYLNLAKETFYGVKNQFASVDEMGYLDLKQTSGALKEWGAFLLTAIELEKAKMLKTEDDPFPVKSKITKF